MCEKALNLLLIPKGTILAIIESRLLFEYAAREAFGQTLNSSFMFDSFIVWINAIPREQLIVPGEQKPTKDYATFSYPYGSFSPILKSNLKFSLRKIPWFHLISWCGNFAARHSFRIVSEDLPETMRKLYLSTKFPHQKIRWN